MKDIDSVIRLLAGLWLISLCGCFAAEAFFRNDAVFFTSVVGMSSTILGALMLKITGKEHPNPSSVNESTITTEVTSTK